MKKDKMIMLGMFAKTTSEYANKRKNQAEELIDEVNITEGDYLIVAAGPFDVDTAEDNLAKLTAGSMEGYIYSTDKKKGKEKSPEEPKEEPEEQT